MSNNKKKPGCLANILAFCLLAGLCVWGIKSCGDRVFAPETPEQAERRQQEDAKKAEQRQQEEAAKAERWKQEETKQADRRKLIEELVNKGVFKKVDFRDSGATIWVDLPFYALDFDTKQNFCSVVYAYVSTHARDELVSVALKDARSGKSGGDFGQEGSGCGLKMKERGRPRK
jgi:hypothetical protein